MTEAEEQSDSLPPSTGNPAAGNSPVDGETGQSQKRGKDPQDRGAAGLTDISCDTKCIMSLLSEIQALIKARMSYDEAKEKAFDRLYQELDELKRHAAFENIRTLYQDMILLYDRMESMEAVKGLSRKARAMINSLKNELLEALEKRDVTVISSSASVFDPLVQQAVGLRESESADEDGKVVGVLRRGFRFRDRVLRPEEVIVAKITRTATPLEREKEEQRDSKGS